MTETGILKSGICAAAALFLSALINTVAYAEDTLPGPVSGWYEALRENDGEKIDTLLTAEAMIELKDIGITQTKSEFIEALDEWTELNSDAVLLTRLNQIDGSKILVDVCYRFTSNETQTSELFYLAGDRITKSVQEQVSETCEGF